MYFFCKFIHPFDFYAYLLTKGLYFDQTLFHKVFSDIYRSEYPGIYHFIFEGMFHQSTNFSWNLIESGQKWSGKCYKGGFREQGQKHYQNDKQEYVIRAVYHSKHHVIPHPVIAAILNVILNILQHWKKTITCQSNSPNITENYQKINNSI